MKPTNKVHMICVVNGANIIVSFAK